MVQFEEHLKEEITVRTNNPVIKWTYELLTTLANNEREKEPYCKMFSEKEIAGFRSIMNVKFMFYPKDYIINLDESAVFFNEIRGRIVVEKGNSKKISEVLVPIVQF